MQKLQPKLLRILSYSFFALAVSCATLPRPIQLPPPTSIPTSIPAELRIGKVDVQGEWVRLSPEQASKLAVQIKFLQGLAEESYLLGRKEGQVALDAMIASSAYHSQIVQRQAFYGIAGSLFLGFGLGVLVVKGLFNE